MSLFLLHNCATFTYTTFRTSPNSLPSPLKPKLYRPLSKGQSTSPLLTYHITLPIDKYLFFYSLMYFLPLSLLGAYFAYRFYYGA